MCSTSVHTFPLYNGQSSAVTDRNKLFWRGHSWVNGRSEWRQCSVVKAFYRSLHPSCTANFYISKHSRLFSIASLLCTMNSPAWLSEPQGSNTYLHFWFIVLNSKTRKVFIIKIQLQLIKAWSLRHLMHILLLIFSIQVPVFTVKPEMIHPPGKFWLKVTLEM